MKILARLAGLATALVMATTAHAQIQVQQLPVAQTPLPASAAFWCATPLGAVWKTYQCQYGGIVSTLTGQPNTWTAAQTFTALSATSLALGGATIGSNALAVTGTALLSGTQTINSGTLTASAPAINATQTWNNSGVAFTGLKLNITNTASNSGSVLLNLSVGGVTAFSVDPTGFILNQNGAPYLRQDAYGNDPSANHSVYDCRRARGTISSPTAVQSGDELCAVSVSAYRPNGFASHAAAFTWGAAENWTNIANGTAFNIWTTKNGTTADSGLFQAATIDGTGLWTSYGGMQIQGGDLTTFNTNIVSGEGFRAFGYLPPSTGVGLEIFYTGGQGNIISLDRGAATYHDLILKGANIIMEPQGIPSWRFDGSTGAFLPATTATFDIGNSSFKVRDYVGSGTVVAPQIGAGGTSGSIPLYTTSSAPEQARFDTSGTATYFDLAIAGTRYAYFGSAGQIISAGNPNDLAIRSENVLLFASGGSTARMKIDASGNLLAVADNAYDAGASGANRFRNLYLAGFASTPAVIASGSSPVLTGTCTTGSQAGGNTAGKYTATCTAQTVIMTFATTAPTGWACSANDNTTPTDSLKQTGFTTTSCTLTGTTAAADVISWSATGW